jgi:hypothetical protein
MKENVFAKKTASKIFWVWVFIQGFLWIISIYDGSALKDMLHSVDYAEKSDASGMDRNEGAWWFVLISLIFFIISTIFAAFLIHFTEKERRWAFLLLVPFSLWSFYYSVSYPFEISEMYSKEIDIWEIFNGLFGGLVWVVILYFAYRQYQAQNIAK